jgi:tetratricopeptide (TPR) repeat protein
VATLVLAALLTLSFFQTTHWKNDEALWRHTVQVTRENDFANGQLGDSLAVQNRFSEAEPFYREALRLNPSLAGVLHNLALVERQKGNPAEAESLLRRATQISPWFTSAQLDLVSVLTVQKKYQEAIDLLTPILQREPHNTDALLQSAVILSENLPSPENLALALQRVQQALTLRPEWPEAHFISGNVLLLSNSPDEAMKAYDTALQKNPRLAPAAHNLGTLLARANRFPEASAAYQKAIAANPDSVEAYDSLADIYVRQKMPAAAISVWKQSLQRKPNEIRVLYKLAWILSTHPEASVRNGKEAEHFAQQAISIAKGSEPLLFDALAAAYAEQERFPEAVESQQKALATLSNKANPLHGALSARLSNYQAKLPFRSEP